MRKAQCVLALMALCVGMAQSWDIAISAGDVIEFYTNGTKTDTVHFKSYNLTALAYDEVHDMMLFVDKQTDGDAICGYKLTFGNITCFIKRNGSNIHDLAFDPATELLFFTDTHEQSINWISLKTYAPVPQDGTQRGNLIMKMDNWTPSDIAIESCSGHIYWISANFLKYERIERALFNGSERMVINDMSYQVFSLAIDQQAQKFYYFDRLSFSGSQLNSESFNGGNRKFQFFKSLLKPQALTVSKDYMYWVTSSRNFKTVWQMPKNAVKYGEYHEISKFYSGGRIGIAANYKIKEQIQGIQDCKALSSLVASNSDELICVHGMKVSGQSVCKCSLGYTGERCDVSTCENYCLQGTCSNSGEGLPKCRCHAGYIGERCEMNACHDYCLNNGTCSLNGNSEPVCQCVGDYNGDRCDVSVCQNYCFQGSCSFNDQGLRKCRCHAGYSGDRCEVNVCLNCCLNDGDCSLNEEGEPVCHCVGNYEGSRCGAVKHATVTNTSTYYSAGRNLTLADLLSNWRKPIAKITVTVAVVQNLS